MRRFTPLVCCLPVLCVMACSLGKDLDHFDQAGSEAGPPDASAEAGCAAGSVEACYDGPAGSAGKGICRAGSRSCADGGWGACTGSVTPGEEVCDGQDNDCDDEVDEGCACTPGNKRPCGTDVGACEFGSQLCTEKAAWGACEGGVAAQLETCNGKDDNCDGDTDENLEQSCYTADAATQGKGQCKAGKQTCSAGAWGVCEGEVTPSTETCDGQDNDCNGVVDDGISAQACYSGPAGTEGRGICHAGTQACTSGSWGACVDEQVPQAEECNGLDDDCNDAVDDEPQEIRSGVPCEQQCLSDIVDADCDGLVGDGAQDKWPSECNPLLFSDDFATAPAAPLWTAQGTTAWSCGAVTLEAGASLTLLQPAQIGVQYLAETRVTMGPEPTTPDWKVIIASAVAPSNERRCMIWKSVVSQNKPTLAIETLYGGSTMGFLIGQPFDIDTTEGASFVMQSYGTTTKHYCRLLTPNGEVLLGEITNSIALPLSNTEGTVKLSTVNRKAAFDHVRVFGITP